MHRIDAAAEAPAQPRPEQRPAFTSMRSGVGDIYWSARQSLAEPFAPLVALDDLNSGDYDPDTTLSVDLGYLMFSSTRSGNAEIYETTAVR